MKLVSWRISLTFVWPAIQHIPEEFAKFFGEFGRRCFRRTIGIDETTILRRAMPGGTVTTLRTCAPASFSENL